MTQETVKENIKDIKEEVKWTVGRFVKNNKVAVSFAGVAVGAYILGATKGMRIGYDRGVRIGFLKGKSEGHIEALKYVKNITDTIKPEVK